MSTGPTTQSSLLQENGCPKQDASQSALCYLYEEVSKLASPVHSTFMETDSVWFSTKEDKQSLHCPSLSLSPQVKNVQTPLKLLNLINQQCERLLNQSEDEEQGNSPLLILDVGNSNISLAPPAVEQLQDSAQPLNLEGHWVRKSDNQSSKGCSPEDTDVCPVRAVAPENTETVHPVMGDSVDAPQTSELNFSVALDLGSDWTEECLSTQHTFYDFLPESQPHEEPSTDEPLAFRSTDTEPLLPLDHNANVCLDPSKKLNSGLGSAESHFCKSCSSLQEQQSDVQVNTASTCEDSSEEIPKPSVHSTSSEKDSGAQHSTWRSKSRKQLRPSRSASVQDPDFQGVTFRMDTELDDSKEKCRLLITSKYSTDLPKNVKRARLRTRTSQKFLKTSSDEDSDSATSDARSKVCASCSTSKTPMWRDAEDGTPLCNACGIRYKKYRVRCINCWHIPKKDGNSVSRCSKCGHFVRLTSAQRRPTI